MTTNNRTSLVPWGLTIGLGVFAFILSIAGYVLRWITEPDAMAVFWHAAVVVPFFVVGVPGLVCLGAYVMNAYQKTQIAMRNAWTLGWLLSCVAILSIMGVYS